VAGIIINYDWMIDSVIFFFMYICIYVWKIFSIVDTDWFVSGTNVKLEVSTDKGEHY
jgi:hypothetical protein